MNKTFLLTFVFLFVISFVVVQAANLGTNANGSQNTVTTQNQGEDSQIRTRVVSGTYFNEEGKEMRVESDNGVKLRVRDVESHSSLEITQSQEQNRTRLHVQLSNGANTEIKVMPDTASETAIARLRLVQCNESNNCTIELKEVGNGEQTKVAYEIKAQKEVRVLGLFRAQMQVQSQIDAENGEVLRAGKPWWAFLAAE